MVKNKPLVDTIQRAAAGDENAKAILDKEKIGPVKQKAVLDRLNAQNQASEPSALQPQQNTQTTPQNNAERGVGDSAPISEETNQQPAQEAAQKQPQQAVEPSQSKQVEQYAPKNEEPQGAPVQPAQQPIGNHVAPHQPVAAAVPAPKEEAGIQRMAKQLIKMRPGLVGKIKKAAAGDVEAQKETAKLKPGLADAVVNELDDAAHKEARRIIETSPAHTRWAKQAGEGDKAARARLRGVGIDEDVEKAIRDELAKKENTNEKKADQTGESKHSENQVEEPARTAGEKQNEAAEEVSKEKAPEEKVEAKEPEKREYIIDGKKMLLTRKDAKRERAVAKLRNETADNIKEKLVKVAEDTWNGTADAKQKVEFAASDKLREATKKLFGTEVKIVTVTRDSFTHVKNHHSENEGARGQKDFSPDDAKDIYDAVNDFDTISLEKPDLKGNSQALVIKGKGDRTYVLLVQKGDITAMVKTAWKTQKKRPPRVVSGNTASSLYVQNADGRPVSSSTSNVPQTDEKGKGAPYHGFLEGKSTEEQEKIKKRLATKTKSFATGKETTLGELVEEMAANPDYEGRTLSNGAHQIRNLNPDNVQADFKASVRRGVNASDIMYEYFNYLRSQNVAEAPMPKPVTETPKAETLKKASKPAEETKPVEANREETSKSVDEEGGFVGDPNEALDDFLAAVGGKRKKGAKPIAVNKKKAIPAVKGKKKEIDTDLPKKEVHPVQTNAEELSPNKFSREGMSDADIDAQIEKEKARLKKALNDSMHRLNANPIFDVNIMVPAFNLGRLYFLKGTRNFADFSKRLVNDIGEEIRPWCQSVWETIKAYPDGVPYNEEAMTKLTKVAGLWYKNGTHTLTDMKKLLHEQVENAGQYDKMLEAAYHGVITFYAERVGIRGDTVKVRTDARHTFEATYKIVPAYDVQASQNTDFSINEKYDSSLQPRERARVAMQKQVNEMAANLDPDSLADSRNLNEGAPIVNPENMVENGNGRTIAIKKAYESPNLSKQAKAYRQYLIDNASHFGLTKEEVESVPNPILVRERSHGSDHLLSEIIQSTNGGARMGAAEQAQIDAEKISTRTLEKYSGNAGGDLTSAANRDFVNEVIHDIAGKNDLNALLTADGSVSSDGIIRVRNALYAKAYNNPDMLARISESTEEDNKRLAHASLFVAPQMALLRNKIADGTIAADLDAPSAVSEAMGIFISANDRAKSAEDRTGILDAELRQQQLLIGDEKPEAVVRLALALDKTVKKAWATDALLYNLVKGVSASDNPMEGSLIETKHVPLEDYVQSAIDDTFKEYGIGGKEGTLFSQTEEKGNGTVPADGLAERNGEGTNQDNLGRNDESGVPGRGSGQGVSSSGAEVRAHSGVQLHDGSTTPGGTRSDSGVQGQTPGTAVDGESESTGSSDNGRSLIMDDDGARSRNIDRGAEEASTSPAPGRPVNEAAKAVVSPKLDEYYGKDSAKRKQFDKDTKPLLQAQKEDVMVAEKRFEDPSHHGVLFTNGTGTGKTFTGLGMISRYVAQGKKNILIVSPNDEVNRQWVKAAKDSFDIDVHTLKDLKDEGEGVTVTTYANFGQNNELVNRDWDLVICDESQNIMGNKESKTTKNLDALRAITKHREGFNAWFDRKHADEMDTLENNRQKILTLQVKGGDPAEVKELETENKALYEKLSHERTKGQQAWDKYTDADRTNVVFLSATPFQYPLNVEYAEGYLFNYKYDGPLGNVNREQGRQNFFIEHFGYRMRYNKLTKPDANVDTTLMEQDFHDWLEETGALSGRQAIFDQDYDRGFLLTPNSVGAKIDSGVSALDMRDKAGQAVFADYRDVLKATTLRRDNLNLLLEYIKAKESIPFIKQYLSEGKKVVVFHQSKKAHNLANPFVVTQEVWDSLDPNTKTRVRKQYELFQSKFPQLFDERLGLDNLKSPIETMKEAFGDTVGFYNGDEKKGVGRGIKNPDGTKRTVRQAAVDAFNDDNGKINVIVVQQDAGGAGINLHDVTGKHQRALLNLSVPLRPSYAIQIEGRIYRTGMKSNAIIRYFTTGTNVENRLFTDTVAGRSAAVENLSLGKAGARALKDSFVNAYEETLDDTWKRCLPGAKGEGTGGKERDYTADGRVKSDWDAAKTYYYGTRKKTSRNKAQEGVDYFATPEPVGLKMVQFAHIKKGDKVLEPSAGHGAISRWFPQDSQNTIVEPSSALMSAAKMHTKNAKAFDGTFEEMDLHNKFDAIVMNPPYGKGGKTAEEHLEKAFKHLNDGGRIVALVPDGPAFNARFQKWIHGNPDGKTAAERRGEPTARLAAVLSLPSSTFERAGTTVRTQILVIDKSTDFAQMDADERKNYAEDNGDTYDLSDVGSVNELFDELENMDMPPRVSHMDRGEAVARGPAVSDTEAAPTSSNFKAGEFKHTKTGEMIPSVSINSRISKEDYTAAKKIATANHGYYSKYSKSFLFKDGGGNTAMENRDAFMRDMAKSEPQYLVTNDEISAQTRIPIIDVTAESKGTFRDPFKENLANKLVGQKIQVVGSGGSWDFGGINSKGKPEDAKHLINSSSKSRGFATRLKIISNEQVLKKVLSNAIYIERHPDVKHGKNTAKPNSQKHQDQIIELYTAVRDGPTLYRVHIVAKDYDKRSNQYTIQSAYFYDMYVEDQTKKGASSNPTSTGKHYGLSSSSSTTISVAELLKNVKDRSNNRQCQVLVGKNLTASPSPKIAN